MSNYFTHHQVINHELEKLFAKIAELKCEDDAVRGEYIFEVRSLLKSHPNLTAAHIAALLSDNPSERKSIKASIATMGYMAEESKRRNSDIKNPTMPELKRKEKKIRRRFVELAEDNSVIREFAIEDVKYTYSVGD